MDPCLLKTDRLYPRAVYIFMRQPLFLVCSSAKAENSTVGEFPGGPVVKNSSCNAGEWVPSLGPMEPTGSRN